MERARRRGFLVRAGTLGLFVAAEARAKETAPKRKAPEEVTPSEDLMREHGVLNRLLLLYDEALRRIDVHELVPGQTVVGAAEIIRRFIEQYHERLEEEHVFPVFEKAGKLVDLVKTLRRQHQAGRVLTERILQLSGSKGQPKEGDKQELASAIRRFIRMYRPHEAREDTVLFPAFRELLSPKDFDALGEAFEDKEHELFGKEGFEGIVIQVGKLEQAAGIYDLDQFTP
jgi:hemerythrin-like domain-containing protein